MAEHELYHYGVPGMKWGVRKSARISKREAKVTRDKDLGNAKTRQDAKQIRSKYRDTIRKIEVTKNKKLSEIDLEHPGYTKATKVCKGILKGAGAVTLVAAGSAAAVGAVAVGAGTVLGAVSKGLSELH